MWEKNGTFSRNSWEVGLRLLIEAVGAVTFLGILAWVKYKGGDFHAGRPRISLFMGAVRKTSCLETNGRTLVE